MPSKYFARNFKPKTYHHILNRGSFKQKIFRKPKDYEVFIDILKYYLRYPTLSPLSKLSQLKLTKAKSTKPTKTPYQLISYCLMPNHFHLLLLQKEKSPTLSDLLKKLSVTYVMYFQSQYNHSGRLFEGRFKSIKIFDNEQLLYLTKYIHLNPAKITAGSHPSVINYPYSSFIDYLKLAKFNKDWLHPNIILDKFFPNNINAPQKYRSYVLGNNKTDIDQKTLASIAID